MNTNRRAFLGGTVAAGALAMVRPVHSGSPADADKTLKMGIIGVGGYGMANARAALQVGGVQVTAVCDVDTAHLERSVAELDKLQGHKPHSFKLYPELLDEADVDVVVIATPPHWHALQLIACLEHGVDVYVEKPLAYDVREGRALVEAARKHSDRIVQVGFQRRQSRAFREAAEFMQAGNAGKIVQADVQIHYRARTLDPTPQEPPATLDWDLWCGPGPKIPYSPQVGHRNWRLEKTSGHGHLVDWGIHNIDTARMMLGLATPKQIIAAGGLYHLQGQITTPDTLTVHFEFDSLPVVWRHRLWGATEWDPSVNNGIFFYGEEATVFAADQRWVVIPKNDPGNRRENAVASELGQLHMADFLQCVRTREQPACTVEEGHRSTTTVQLGMIAYESNSIVCWDEATEQIVDNPSAGALLKRDYRPPYVHPYRQTGA